MDGALCYPNSCVAFVRLRHAALRRMYSYLREREAVLQKDIERSRGTDDGAIALIRLQEVESQLIWMAHNCEIEAEMQPVKRHGRKSRKAM